MIFSTLRHVAALLWQKQPLFLTLFVTNRCNAKCPYCFYLQSTSNVDKSLQELGLEEIRRIASHSGELLWLAFSGGEVFLRKDLVDISRAFYSYSKPVYMLYPTNGSLPTIIRKNIEQIAQSCHNSVIVVKLSLDGLHQDHDLLRNTSGSFDKTMQTYALLSELVDDYPNLNIGVNTVFCADNQDKMPEIIRFVHSLRHISTHTISLIRGDLRHPRYQRVDLGKYAQACALLANQIKQRDSYHYRFLGAKLKTAQDIMQRRLIYQTAVEQKQQVPCYAGKAALVLSEYGEVYPCEMWRQSLGNIRENDYDIHRVMQSALARRCLDQIQKNACHCTHECNYLLNILLNPKLYPTLAMEYLKLQVA